LTSQLQNSLVLASSTRSSSIGKHIENWEKAHKIYYGPERDTKNFPIKKMPETNPPVRMGFVPESFFQALYNKTGVTGPYVFGAGFLTYLLSKEIWIVEHGFAEFIAFWIGFYILQRKVGPGLRSHLDKDLDLFRKKRWDEPIEAAKAQASVSIKECEEAIEKESGQKYLYEAKRENVDLQLEAQYRQRLADVHHAVKRRLDYQVEVAATNRNFQQQHMVNWIVRSVTQSITPQQEKESLSKCMQDLKGLAARA